VHCIQTITYLIDISELFLSKCGLQLCRIFVLAPQYVPPTPVFIDPCVPSPCGPYSECRRVGDSPSCSCRIGYIGSPPNCRPECTINSECSSNLACIQQKCQDPCPGSCGANAQCNVFNHIPMCLCVEGYEGDPFTSCYPKPPPPPAPIEDDPCNPSPCGPNAQCSNGVCTCLPEYHGDPYQGCRPECIMNTECARNRACMRNKCDDPCPGTCGQNAICEVINHVPSCRCPDGMEGSPFIACRPALPPPVTNPCIPSPCGPNSQCRNVNGQAVCSCVPGFNGSPPACRPECVVNAECPQNQACQNQKCRDPCPGTCGYGARCMVVNHSPICTCQAPLTGNPFTRCEPVGKYRILGKLSSTFVDPKIMFIFSAVIESPPEVPCQPSPCGPNAECRVAGNQPSCSCLEGFVGAPPNCRPECVSNSDCASHLACINQKCRDPCPGTCAPNAECRTISHVPRCTCIPGYTGDPFTQCQVLQCKISSMVLSKQKIALLADTNQIVRVPCLSVHFYVP